MLAVFCNCTNEMQDNRRSLVKDGAISNFYDKTTDSNLSVLFAFFNVADKVQSALLMQEQAF
jgi:hypothetical protein